MTDDELDVLLTAAGTRWRAQNASPAQVDLDAIGGPALIPLTFGDVPTTEKRRHFRGVHWLAGLVGAAAIVAVVVGVTFAVRGPSRPEATGPSSAATSGTSNPASGVVEPQLVGTSWKLANFTDAAGKTSQAVNGASVSFATDHTVSASDGVNTISGPYTASGSTAGANGDSAGDVTFGQMATSAVGVAAPSAGYASQSALYAKLFEGSVDWRIYGGGKLALSRAGVGTLVFVSAAPTSTDPSELAGTSWRLDSTENGNAHTTYDWVTPEAAPSLIFGTDGTVDASDAGCGRIDGTVNFSDQTLTIHNEAQAGGCSRPPVEIGQLVDMISTILLTPGVRWSYTPGGELRISAGTKALDYTRATAPSSSTTAQPTPPKTPTWISTRSWRLDGFTTAKSTQIQGASLSLSFAASGRFAGTDDCARVSGDSQWSAQKLVLSDVRWTDDDCASADPALDVEKRLLADGTLSWSNTGSDTGLALWNDSEGRLLFADSFTQSPNPEMIFAGMAWAQSGDPTTTLRFNSNLTVTLSDSCGQSTGRLNVNTSTLSIAWPRQERACAAAEPTAREILGATSARWSMTDYQELTLASGNQLVQFMRTK